MINEVLQLQEAEAAIKQHITQNEAWYQELRRLVEIRNSRMEQADKVVRASGTSEGPFMKLSESIKVDVDKLHDLMGDAFNAVGGYTEEVTIYKIDRDRFFASVEREPEGSDLRRVAEMVLTREQRYKRMSVYQLP